MAENDGAYLGDPGVFTMTPEQATAQLAALKTQYDAANAPVASAASGRLHQIFNDPKTRDSYLAGNLAVVREVEELHKQVLAAGDAPDVLIETVDSVSDPSAVPRFVYEGLLAGVREQGLDPGAENFLRAADSGSPVNLPTEGDKIVAQRALARLLTGKTDQDLVKDFQLRANWTTLNAVIALATEDGRPVSEGLQKLLVAHGLW